MSPLRLRVLIAVLVYNGRDFVPRTLESLARLPATTALSHIAGLPTLAPRPSISKAELRATGWMIHPSGDPPHDADVIHGGGWQADVHGLKLCGKREFGECHLVSTIA